MCQRGSTSYDQERDCPQRNCIAETVTWYLNVLKSTDSPLAAKQLTPDYLVHLVGDLYPPLHVGFLDDAGGTKTKVTFEGRVQTLRELWDAGILSAENGSAREIADRLDQECSADGRTACTVPPRIVPAMIRETGGREDYGNKKHSNTGEVSSISAELEKFTIRLNIPGTGIRISSLLLALLKELSESIKQDGRFHAALTIRQALAANIKTTLNK